MDMRSKFGAMYCVYNDIVYLDLSVESFKNLDKVLFLIDDQPWNGDKSDNSETIKLVKSFCSRYPNFELVQGHWGDETIQRNYGLEKLFKEDIDYCFIVDADEVYHNFHVENIKKYILDNQKFSAYHIEWNTYWSKDYYVITPREAYTPVICVKVSEYKFTQNRLGTTSIKRTRVGLINTEASYNGILIPPETAFCFHLSYARNDEDISKKIKNFSHAPEIIEGWYENVWKKWDPSRTDLHPVRPAQYKKAVKEDFMVFPDQLKTFIKKERMKSKACNIIILNWNSCELLKKCLSCIEKNTDGVFYKVIIVDNGSSKDNSIAYLKSLNKQSFSFPLKIIYNDKNLGFAGGVNKGINASDPNSDICLLNVDAEVQPGWLKELYNTMINNPECGLVGPLGNEIENKYQSEGSITEDISVPNLFFFCTLIFSEVIEKIGLLDNRYGYGGYDDNDYGTRARLAGYTHYISAKSLVRHKAHQVFVINGLDNYEIEIKNRELFFDKFFGIMFDYSRQFNLFTTEYARKSGLVINDSG